MEILCCMTECVMHTILLTQNLMKSVGVCARKIEICRTCYHREYECVGSQYSDTSANEDNSFRNHIR